MDVLKIIAPALMVGAILFQAAMHELVLQLHPMVRHYLSLVKFSHTIFALPFALTGFCLGLSYNIYSQAEVSSGRYWQLFLLVLLCMVSARSAAMGFNRWLDRKYDAANPRTAIREIPSGLISARHAFTFVVFCCLLFVAATWWINPLCFYLSPVALFVILFYSYTKRFTAFCHLVLGLGLSLAPVGAFLAVTGTFQVLPLLFSGVVICWVSGFDIIYALQDEAFDAGQGLFSMPAWLGAAGALHISRILHFIASLLLIIAGLAAPFHYFYWLGVLVFCGMLLFQQLQVSPGNLTKVNLAFMTSNGIASVVFGLLICLDLYLFNIIQWDVF